MAEELPSGGDQHWWGGGEGGQKEGRKEDWLGC